MNFFILLISDVPNNIAHSWVKVFHAQILSFVKLVKIVLAYVTRVVYTQCSQVITSTEGSSTQVLKKRKVMAKQRKLTFPFPIVSQTKVAFAVELDFKSNELVQKTGECPVRSLDMGY